MRDANLKSLRVGDDDGRGAIGEDWVSSGTTCAPPPCCCGKMDRSGSSPWGDIGGEYEVARMGLDESGEETEGRYLVCWRGVVEEEEDATGAASKVNIGVGIMANIVMASCSQLDG